MKDRIDGEDAVAEEPGENVGKKSNKLMSNAVSGRSLDHAMIVGSKHGLEHFVREDRIRPLRASEERFWVDPSFVPGYVAEENLPDGVQWKRACVENIETKATRLEVIAVHLQPAFFSVPDQGSKMWPFLFFMYSFLGVFGWMYEDPSHRAWNDVRSASRAAGIWLVILETTIVCNLRCGPFDGAAFYGQICEGVTKFFAISSGIKDALFLWLYEAITRDTLDGKLDRHFGFKTHLRETFDSIKSASCFTSKGHKVKIMRWFSWFDAVVIFLPVWHAFMMILIFILKLEGTIKVASDLIRNQNDIERKAAAAKALAKAKAIPA